MIFHKQTLETFNEMVTNFIQEFQIKKEKYGWEYSHTIEQFGEISKFIISSGDFVTILNFNPTAKTIHRYDITSVDLKLIQKLNEGIR